MIILGIDFGDARMGFALCDPEERMAYADGICKVNGIEHAATMAAEKAISALAEAIVVGMPRNMDGSYGPRAERTERFISVLASKCTLPIERIDERLTTVAAHTLLHEAGIKKGKSKGVVDAVAAKLILESFIEKRKRTV